jgi:hypothetical protein
MVVSPPRVTIRDRKGGAIKITIWLVTRDRDTWVTGAEIVCLTLVLIVAVESTVGRAIGLLVLAHLGYRALTSLPMGAIPGRPLASRQERRNLHLRARIVGFINEVRRVEEYVQRARTAGRPRVEVEMQLRSAERRLMEAAAEVVRFTGRAEA